MANESGVGQTEPLRSDVLGDVVLWIGAYGGAGCVVLNLGWNARAVEG